MRDMMKVSYPFEVTQLSTRNYTENTNICALDETAVKAKLSKRSTIYFESKFESNSYRNCSGEKEGIIDTA